MEKFNISTWIEWIVCKDQPPKINFLWEFLNYTEGNGILILNDKSRNAYTKLTTIAWFLKFGENDNFWFYKSGEWSIWPKARP